MLSCFPSKTDQSFKRELPFEGRERTQVRFIQWFQTGNESNSSLRTIHLLQLKRDVQERFDLEDSEASVFVRFLEVRVNVYCRCVCFCFPDGGYFVQRV